VHAHVDRLGRLVAFTITPEQRGDAPVAPEPNNLPPPFAMRAADQAYDSDALRRLPIARGRCRSPPTIPTGSAYVRSNAPAASAATSVSAPSVVLRTSDASQPLQQARRSPCRRHQPHCTCGLVVGCLALGQVRVQEAGAGSTIIRDPIFNRVRRPFASDYLITGGFNGVGRRS